jgi:transposase
MDAVEVVKSSLPAPGLLSLEGLDQMKNLVVVRVSSKETPQCPACLSSRVSYHSRYDRHILDLPWQGRPVQIRLQTRRFRCRNADCQRKIFAECVPAIACARAHESSRLREIVGVVGYALGGRPAARLLKQLGIDRSADTVLRRVKARARDRKRPPVRVLGVDDWAWRKQQRYGTLLMDLEQSEVIDLLPKRSADSFAAWLTEHGEVEIIARDRCGLYADGGRQAAPAAEQVADRYHLVSNLSEALERDVQRLQIEARAKITKQKAADDKPGKRLTLIEARRQRCRQARYERYLAVKELALQHHTQLAIAEKVGVSMGTVSRWLNAPDFPERQLRSNRHRDQALFLQKQHGGLHPRLSRVHYSSGRIATLLMKPESVSAEQKRYLEVFLQFCPPARQLRRLALQFRALLRGRKVQRLTAWMKAAISSGFPFLAQFARALHRDMGAVTMAVKTHWSNGPVEGHINRLKMIKRQMTRRL